MPESWVQEADGQAVLAAAEVTDLTAELQKLAAAPVFSGIAFEGAIDRLHEKVLILPPAADSETFVKHSESELSRILLDNDNSE